MPAAAVLPLPCFLAPGSHTFRAIICLIDILILCVILIIDLFYQALLIVQLEVLHGRHSGLHCVVKVPSLVCWLLHRQSAGTPTSASGCWAILVGQATPWT